MRAAPPTRPHLLLLLLLPGRGRQQRRFLQLGSFLPLLLLLLAAWCPAVRKRKRLLLDRVAAVRPSAETALFSMILMCLSRACLGKGSFFIKKTAFQTDGVLVFPYLELHRQQRRRRRDKPLLLLLLCRPAPTQ